MNDLQKQIHDSANFYKDQFIGFDYKLADYNFKTLKTYFKGLTALELGPASGYMTKSLVNEFEQLDIVEGSEMLLNEIPEYPNVKKYLSYFEEFETKKKYDSIIMSHVLEHIKDPILVLRKISNWLKPDGVFLISVPNARSIHRMVAVEMGLLANVNDLNQRDKDLGHYRVYDSNLLKLHVEDSGFEIIDSGGIFLKPLSNFQIENNWTKEMMDGFYEIGKKFPENCAEIFIACKIKSL